MRENREDVLRATENTKIKGGFPQGMDLRKINMDGLWTSRRHVDEMKSFSGDHASKSKFSSSTTISYVTSNPNKFRETVQILGKDLSPMLKQVNIDLPEYQGSVEYVATQKCEFACAQVDGPVLVEDTGLGFDALNGLPGPYIKWFLQAVGPPGLRKMVIGFGPENNAAAAVCTFAYCPHPGAGVRLFQGVTRGRIVEPRGDCGFGWDSCFQPDAEGLQTYAEMDKDAKNAISHRSKAVASLREFLQSLLNPERS